MIRVIVVEDDPMISQLNVQYLSQFPELRVEAVFSNGRDALSYLQTHETELAVVDIYMPMVSGLELLRGIRSSGLQTGVILLTAATEMSAVEEALRSGAIRTRDMGGHTTTSQAGDAVASKVLELAGKA